jgi:hypothetical protein
MKLQRWVWLVIASKPLTPLAVRIHEIEARRDTMRREFIQDTAFERLEGTYRDTITEPCAAYVLKKAEQS